MAATVRKPGGWMQLPIDDRILEALAGSNMALTPAVIAYNIDKSRAEASRRLTVLVDAGLAVKEKRGYYRISETGSAYLEGCFDAAEVEGPVGAD